ncbi:hypothetical protein GUJ93_ZPchr0002g23633 [Zizania palustris]|uniref:Uncharacterized protein n=1 Tax=Zizania palustris TaxID=103762 RepID=A0A8J5S7D8_ZIZPA|nr:hypothetical protein GUJ93_ZPchr0002g23633 [Zizania palustris]
MLEEIALKCGSKVEYRASLCDTSELHFSIEVYWNFYSMTMIDKYLSSEPNKMSDMKENGFGGSIAALKELVEVGWTNSRHGVGTTWEEAKLQFV